MTPFRPTARQINLLLIVGFVPVGYALYMRYLVVEPSVVGLACDGGLKTWLCGTRKVFMFLFNNSVFGTLALVAAAAHFVRPSLSLFALALSGAAFGLVLYNTGLSALAAGLLILSFARPMTAKG
jgi:hypothetical protein